MLRLSFGLRGRTLKILGIDPGLASIGIGLVELGNSGIKYKASWLLVTSPHHPMPTRLAEIGRDIECVLKTCKPDEIAIEKLFFGKNVSTAMIVAQARGVILSKLSAYEVVEYTPNEIKMLACGLGHATKRDMKREIDKMVSGLKDDNTIDGIGIALAHARILLNTRAS